MRPPFLVCPLQPDLLKQLQGYQIILRIPELEQVEQAVEQVNRASIRLECLYVTSRLALGLQPVSEKLKGIPLALRVPSMGLMRDVAIRLPLLRQLSIRVFMPMDSTENLTSIRILASLGIACTVLPGTKNIKWDLFSDLASYALLGLTPHGSIEPFHTLAREYQPAGRTELGGAWFTHPEKFIHVDSQGRFAFSQDELDREEFAGAGLQELHGIFETPAFQKHQEQWREQFLTFGGCATCPGWRICRGTFSVQAAENPECRKAFQEILDIVELKQAADVRGNHQVWQL
ncbi:MAG: hypothetical protein EHM64_03825 [Ignavibacteriae bacterium]|nr:MAG: hypothetical protein EHM64_03825 [Ignavibacteriota bacterium]